MGRPTKKKMIERQVTLWKERVWMPDVVPEMKTNEDGSTTVVNNEAYNKVFSKNFTCMFCHNKEDIYKIFRYGIEKGAVYNSGIVFVRNGLFEAYISPELNITESYDLCKELFKAIIPKGTFESKWIICDSIECDFNDKLASYFISQLKSMGASGIVFSCNTKLPNNLYSCIKSSNIEDIIEF